MGEKKEITREDFPDELFVEADHCDLNPRFNHYNAEPEAADLSECKSLKVAVYKFDRLVLLSERKADISEIT